MKHRKNRRDTDDTGHTEVHENPKAYTRATRRAVGHRGGVHVEAMRGFYATERTLPRAIRRLMRDSSRSVKRMQDNRAKVNRLLAPYGVHL
ncbi:MAG: hypothetical protein H0W36_05200 [Gemmatimonadetes bacterium]|nr:hypothetical protein [Gemmatimonadota bacterium]